MDFSWDETLLLIRGIWPAFGIGSFLEPKKCHTAQLDHRGAQDTSFETGAIQLLRMFINLMQDPCDE